MEHKNLPDHIKIGQWGEEIACNYLKNKGYVIIDRNFRRKWGEIDIVCRKSTRNDLIVDKKCSTWNRILGWFDNVLRGTYKNAADNVPRLPTGLSADKAGKTGETLIFVEVKTLKPSNLNPEENVTPAKQKKLIRTCELYMSHNNMDLDTDWQIDVVAVMLDIGSGKAKIRHLEKAVFY